MCLVGKKSVKRVLFTHGAVDSRETADSTVKVRKTLESQ